MQITSVRIKRTHNNNRILGVASIQLDNCIVIHDIKLVQLEDKRILSFPNKITRKYEYDEKNTVATSRKEYSDIVHPSTKEFREYLETELFKIYDLEEVAQNNE